MKPPVVYHPSYFSDIGAHVFPTEKFDLVYSGLKATIEDFEDRVHRPEPASREMISRVHTSEYLADLESAVHSHRTIASELPMSKEIVDAYVLMTGGTVLAAKLAVTNGCSINLGGGFHHAFSDKAEGFCYINDIAVAVRELLAGKGEQACIDRAAVIDTDLHQGNGTARIFLDDPDVATFSIHQENNYPYKQKSDLDVGLEDGVKDREYLERLEDSLVKIFSEFIPQFVLYVGGVDPYENDQLGGLKITKQGMKARDTLVFEYCRKRAVPVAAVLAGGYAWNVMDTVEMHMNTYLSLQKVFAG